MSRDPFDHLPLTAEEREKIAALGVPNPVALLEMVQAAPGSFETWFGRNRARELTALLEGSVSPQERIPLKASPPKFPTLGAILDRKNPALRAPDYDLATRDRLFDQLQRLRQKGDSSPETKRQIAQLEQSLNALLEKA
jgi:hypothetical protein